MIKNIGAVIAVLQLATGVSSMYCVMPEVVQVVLPTELCPFGEVSWQPDLSDPDVRIGDG